MSIKGPRGWSQDRVWRTVTFRSLVALLLVVQGACGPARRPQPSLAPPTGSGAVTLQPGDKVSVQIWREEDLSGQFTVLENGTITFPLLGERDVTGIPVSALRESLTEDYRRQLRNPSIEIVALRNVLVLGAVETPGPYEVNPITTVLGVIARAGGVNSGGTLDKIEIHREGQRLIEQVPAGATLSSLNLRSGDQIVVGNRPWLMRNQAFLVSVILAIPSVIYTITRIGN